MGTCAFQGHGQGDGWAAADLTRTSNKRTSSARERNTGSANNAVQLRDNRAPRVFFSPSSFEPGLASARQAILEREKRTSTGRADSILELPLFQESLGKLPRSLLRLPRHRTSQQGPCSPERAFLAGLSQANMRFN